MSRRRIKLYVVDGDSKSRQSIAAMTKPAGFTMTPFVDAESFLKAYRPQSVACLVLEWRLAGMDGLELVTRLRRLGDDISIVMIAACGDVKTAVEAMRRGCNDFLEKPFTPDVLLAAVRRALTDRRANRPRFPSIRATELWNALSPRQREILCAILAGAKSATIAADLGISKRTVDTFRHRIYQKLGVHNLGQLAGRFASLNGPSGGSR
jgi:two-component system response regulator FixJ